MSNFPAAVVNGTAYTPSSDGHLNTFALPNK
jgi:hypothetical protein